jgi:HK97 family phage prohead protease
MKITMPVTITASDAETRIIAGRIVQWDAEGNTSAGRTKFLPNSIEFGKNTKLVLEHNRTKPLGKLVEWSQDDTGITASFKIAKTTAGNDALEEAATGLRSDFSVGVEVDAWDNNNGVMAISASKLIEVSLVTDGAIPGAEVEKVAATEAQGQAASESTPEPQIEEPKTEGEDLVSETVSEAVSTEAVEAAKAEVKATSYPLNSQKVRNPIVDKASYLEHSVRAALGDETSKLYVAAAADTTDNAGLIPTRQLTEIVNGVSNADRGAIDAISRGTLPDAGMSFEIPKITQPALEGETAEGGTPFEQDVNTSFISVPVKKFAGQQTFSVELLDRSNPAFFTELVRQMEFAYAKTTDAFVATGMINNGALNATANANSATGILAYTSSAAAAVYGASLGFARSLIVSPDQWGNIMGYNDAGRPIYNAAQPQNAAGVATPTSLRGNVAGLDLYVSRSLSGTADSSMIVVNPESYTWYESPRLQLSSNLISTGQVQVMYYGYGALATKIANGANRFNFT